MMATILLCDDDVYILRAAELKVRAAGFRVLTAYDGEEAWELLQTETVSALVTDRQMPRVDGVELIRRVRESEQLSKLPIVLLTSRAHDLPEVVDADLIMDKPFSPRNLAAQLTSMVETQPIG